MANKRNNKRLTKKEKLDLVSKVKGLSGDELDYLNALVYRRIEEAREEIYTTATGVAYAIIFMVLRDKCGFEMEELSRVWEYTNSYADDVQSGRLKLKDLVDTLRDEANIYLALNDKDMEAFEREARKDAES